MRGWCGQWDHGVSRRAAAVIVAASVSGFGRAAILALFAFMGMETSLCASGEVERPERNIPKALAISMFGYVCSDILGSPRILFAFARDGLLPRVLGRTHPRTHAPHVAIVCYAGLALISAMTGTFAELAVLSALTSAAFYIAGCAAAW